MILGEPFLPNELEWLIRAQAGLSSIRRTSKLPGIIPPLPTGDTKNLKIWREYWKQHDAATRQSEREKVLDKFEEIIRLHDVDELLYADLYNEFLVIYNSLRSEPEQPLAPEYHDKLGAYCIPTGNRTGNKEGDVKRAGVK